MKNVTEKHIEGPAPKLGIKGSFSTFKRHGAKVEKFSSSVSNQKTILKYSSPLQTESSFINHFNSFLPLSICYTLGKTGALIIKKAFPTKKSRKYRVAL